MGEPGEGWIRTGEEQVRPGKDEGGQEKDAEVRKGWCMTGKNERGRGRKGKDRQGQGRLGKDSGGWGRLGEAGERQGRTGE